MSEQGEGDDSPERELTRRRARLVKALKETERFRQLLRDAADRLREDASLLTGESEQQRRRLLLDTARRFERYAEEMDEAGGPRPSGLPEAGGRLDGAGSGS
ncbi:MAG: hypothetical protein HYR63_20250 [Proteobacteria bacterium]|nr:hypothetical protein [Pseudomonadota bacterium]MBI3497065.1 hypothetical protein [Pseudomonadota bacterium]